MTDWDEIERNRYTQSGKGAGEFGSPWQQIENNADNPYQKRQGNKSPSPHFKKYLLSLKLFLNLTGLKLTKMKEGLSHQIQRSVRKANTI